MLPLDFHNPDQEYLCFCSFRALISLGLIQDVRYLECLVGGDSSGAGCTRVRQEEQLKIPRQNDILFQCQVF